VNSSPDVLKDLARTGKLRAALNLGNPVLVQTRASGETGGVTVDLAHELGRRLGVPVEFSRHDTAAKSLQALKSDTADVAFLAIEPARAAEIAFTAPYVLIEGTYMVRADSPLRAIEEVDREGHRIAVGAGSAYDLCLTRTLKAATLVRSPTSEGAIEMFVRDRLEVGAGVRQPLAGYARAHAGFRVMDGRFMQIRQAMATQHGRAAGARYLHAFVEEMKASGFVADALKRSGQPNAEVAGAEPV